MVRRKPLLFLTAAVCAAAGAQAADNGWSFDFRQGVAEYAVGSFAGGGSHLALSCIETGAAKGSASVSLVRAGFAPDRATPATFVTERGNVTLTLDAQGTTSFARHGAAPTFDRLWRLLATSRTLRITYGPGEPMQFPLTGAAALLGPAVCPKQLAQ